jgi:hypothetical protein
MAGLVPINIPRLVAEIRELERVTRVIVSNIARNPNSLIVAAERIAVASLVRHILRAINAEDGIDFVDAPFHIRNILEEIDCAMSAYELRPKDSPGIRRYYTAHFDWEREDWNPDGTGSSPEGTLANFEWLEPHLAKLIEFSNQQPSTIRSPAETTPDSPASSTSTGAAISLRPPVPGIDAAWKKLGEPRHRKAFNYLWSVDTVDTNDLIRDLWHGKTVAHRTVCEIVGELEGYCLALAEQGVQFFKGVKIDRAGGVFYLEHPDKPSREPITGD